MKAVYSRKLLLGLFVSLYFPVSSFALGLNQEAVNGYAKAYTLIIGQEYTLSRIADKYPELAMQVELSRASFNARFSNAEKKLKEQLITALGNEFQDLDLQLKKQVQDILGSQQLTKESSLQFVQKVMERSKGDIETPIFEYLLAAKYNNNSSGEMRDGFRQDYKTDGSGKSQGIKLRMELPRSWKKEEGKRPHIVTQWSSINGNGLEHIMLSVYDAQGYQPTHREIKELVSSNDVKELIPNGAIYIDSGFFTIESQPGYWVQMNMTMERVGVNTYQELVQYQFFFKGKAISIMCAVSGTDDEKKHVHEMFSEIKNLCPAVVNSIVLEQVYVQ